MGRIRRPLGRGGPAPGACRRPTRSGSAHERYLWDTGFHWGEWLEPGSEITDFGAFVAADKSEVATAYLHRSSTVMAQVAEVLGKPTQTIDRYRRLAAGTLDAWQREFIRDDGTLVVQTQASHVRALMFGLVPEARARRPPTASPSSSGRPARPSGTGFLSTGMLLPALAEHGHLDLAYELLLQPRSPGWMYMIDRARRRCGSAGTVSTTTASPTSR